MKRSWIKRGTKQLKAKTSLRREGVSEVKKTKKRIQALLRKIVIQRDGGCILRRYLDRMPPRYMTCNDVLQAEHLVTRSNSGSYGDLKNVVCLCSHHHIHFKPQHSQLYWEFIEDFLGEAGWNYYKRMRDDHKAHRMTLWDWQKLELSLIQEAKRYENANN